MPKHFGEMRSVSGHIITEQLRGLNAKLTQSADILRYGSTMTLRFHPDA